MPSLAGRFYFGRPQDTSESPQLRSHGVERIGKGHFHRGLRRGAVRLARPERCRIVGLHHRTAQRGVGGRTCALAQTRPVGQALCVFLGRRHLCAGAAGRRGAVPAGDHRRHA
jgi:hypothetical protein